MALVLSIAFLKVFLMAYLSIHGLRILVLFFFINSLCMIVWYVHCSSTQALPINLIVSNVEGFIL
jgi:hypothetical protein